MKIEIDTKEDSHDEIRKVIKLLQHFIGDSQEIFSNAPSVTENAGTSNAFNNIFGDNPSSANSSDESSAQMANETPTETKEEPEETSESTDDLFAELFSEEELKKMEPAKEEEEEFKPQKKKYSVELY